jgi:TIR domain
VKPRVAKVLKEYLPEVLDGVDLFMSDKDIGPGERSMRVLESQLDDTTYGLLVVTAENQGESWLNFEAGALSKQVGKDEDEVPRVVPLLVDIDSPNLLTGPLSQFQAIELNAEGLLRTIRSIAAFVGSDAAIIEERFRRAWPDMNKALTEAKRSRIPTKKPERSVASKIDEVFADSSHNATQGRC